MFRVLTFVGILLSSLYSQAQEITLANGEWAPYLSKNLKHAGYMSHIVSDAFKEEGITVKYVFLPWKRGYEEAKDGKYEGSLIWGYNDDRAQSFYFSEPVAELGTSLFHLKSNPLEWSKPEDLAKYRIGGVLGYAYGIEDLEKQGLIKVTRIGKDVGNYKKLAAGRLDIVLEDTEVGYASLKKLKLNDKIIADPTPLKARKYSVIISKKTPNAQALMEAFNRGLKKVIADGRYQKYLDASRRGEY